MSNERSGFSSRLGFVLATAGSAVGLGNIWRFPYLAAKYGGGTFLLTYLILTLTFGFSLMITEVALGRKAGTSAIRAFGHFSKKHTFIGYLTTIIPFIIFPYYCVIGGWVTKYALISLQGGIHNAASDTFFTGFISKSAEPMICVLVFLIATTVVVAGGVKGGVEPVSYTHLDVYKRQAHIRLGVDGRQADQQIRGAVVLPHGTGKEVKVLVFAKDAKAEEAKAAGAEFVGAEELIPKIQKENWYDFDVVVATPDMMGVVGRLGRDLGPKGLMPNPKAGTVTMDVANAIKEIKAGKIEYRLDKSNIIHVPVGKASFTEEQLADNFQTLIDAIVKAKPAAAKGQYFRNVTITSTMGPGVKIDTTKFA